MRMGVRIGMRMARLAISVGATLALLWLGGFLLFASQLPTRVVTHPVVSDAIVVLTGGRGRLQAGLKLLASGGGARLLISGVNAGISAKQLRTSTVEATRLFTCCVDLGYQAHDTRGNAVETAQWMQRRGYDSLHLVTASYHMPRSLLLFQAAMPTINVHANPVLPEHVKLTEWWLFPGTLRLLAMEYSKYLVSLIRVRLTEPSE
ncbi:MAG: YdcF family protein, partial [Alphaproteobacteria bacterium]|nr:YdcF family protein [Alphaproteobacteria bacterium]